jgi:hypothetical protein
MAGPRSLGGSPIADHVVHTASGDCAAPGCCSWRCIGPTSIIPTSQAPVEQPLLGAEQGRQLGSDGTPEVLEFAAAELGACMETSYGSARALMADALALRHRLPELWQLILTGTVPSWKTRKVAQATMLRSIERPHSGRIERIQRTI